MINELIYDLYYVNSKSHKEKEMIEFISDWVEENLPKAIFEEDAKGNLYITKGTSDTYPCIVAHMDEVHDVNPNKQVLYHENVIFGYDVVNHKPTGIGADDKNGIYIALECLLKYDNIKAAFFVQEEVGCLGSRNCDINFFDDCRFVIQCDRRGNSDFITTAGSTELCSRQFVQDCRLEAHGYKTTTGLSTDVMALKQAGLNVSCVNLSCGYYNPHRAEECTDVNDLEKCMTLVQYIIENCTKVYKHEVKKTVTRKISDTAGTSTVSGTTNKKVSKFVADRANELMLCGLFIREYLERHLDSTPHAFYADHREFFDYINYADVCRLFYKIKKELCEHP